MKKTLTISALVAVLSLPSFAEIANNATCNNTNLGKSANGDTAQTEAVWNANTININWYNGDTKITSNTCTYDGQITLPTAPSKPGYTFAGWRLRAAPVGPNCSAITNSTTCENTDGCIYNDGCHVAIPVESAPYTKCTEITDRETCLSIKGGQDFENRGAFSEVCRWNNEACEPLYGHSLPNNTLSYHMIPKSWCDEYEEWEDECMWDESYEACFCYDD